MIIEVKDTILLFYKEIEIDPHHRYRSWEHCYSFFQEIHSKCCESLIDAAALQLAFYLASWGMYRGSSQLLQKDYQVHMPIVAEIFNKAYNDLWSIDYSNIGLDGPEVDLIMQLSKTITHIYSGLGISPTDTLVTKVMLGTFGCIPAYDTLFINGVTYWNQVLPEKFRPKFPARFSKNSFRGLIDFSRTHEKEIEEAQVYIMQRGIAYPTMKLLDMYFWSLGFQIS